MIESNIEDDYPKLVISLPPFNVFGLDSEIKGAKLNFYNMKEEFLKLFQKAKRSIYICSPFLQLDGFDEFIPVLIFKARQGVKIKIISRQISPNDTENRYAELKKIHDIFVEHGVEVSIKNYHYGTKSRVNSSLHAKLIVCDNDYAYIGSGELRKASFDKNFELGIILHGDNAKSLGTIFDKLFSVAKDIDFGKWFK